MSEPNYLTARRQNRRRLIGRLEKGSGAERQLAATLVACTEADPCLSGACTECGGRLQLAALDLADRFVREPARALRGRMTMITVVPTFGCVLPGELDAAVCRRVLAAVEAAAVTSGITPSIFSLDISFNEDLTGGGPPAHWCIHSHGVAVDWFSPAQQAPFRFAFQPSDWVKRPVKFDPIDASGKSERYALKPDRIRRVTELSQSRLNARGGPSTNTKRRGLRAIQADELAMVEHQLGLGGRVIGCGIDDDAVERALGGFNWARDGP
ncbi:hypothetical protein [Methylobacterium sp. E-045]|uniref:hypothetical protein n=1 Tax=Methylobacterium sp. E-045 TaxID=2836575 RepID=UPI001FB9D068|nr:hypothetical protein [Methylobacterium sp. E-045]MCJ2128681.1 hypothetical protein [Methylobacterium sp. E-045]